MARKKSRGDESGALPGVVAAVSATPEAVADGTDTHIVSLPDSLTIHGVRRFKESLQQYAGQSAVTVDLHAIREIDTAGLQLLLAFLRHMRMTGAAFSWVGGPGVVTAAARSLGLAAELSLTGAA